MEGPKNSKGGKMDRLSSLPDRLLHLIMPFMDTKEAVQTCVLSKRWKNLWTTLPYLNFTFDPMNDYYRVGVPGTRFTDLVNTTLLFRERSNVYTFRLSCSKARCEMPVDSWVRYVLNHNPKVLHISISSRVVPIGGVFTCSSLEDVSIAVKRYKPSTRVIKLPHLKRLYLERACLNQDFVEKLFHGCPVVETLHFNRCALNFSTINSCSLKYLSLQGLCCEEGKVLELINAPNLLSFEYSGCPNYLGLRAVLDLPSLTNANIQTLCVCYHQVYKGNGNIFVGISNVQNLELSGVTVKELLENGLLKCSNLKKLKDLCVDGLCLSCNFSLLCSLLNCCPNLGKISLFYRGCECKMRKEHGNRESLNVAPFQCNQLKTVEVQFCTCDKDMPRIVKYLKDGVENSGAQINVSTCLNWCAPYWFNWDPLTQILYGWGIIVFLYIYYVISCLNVF